jgi:hypothetical protein
MYVSVADLDGDDRADVIASAVTAGEVAWWKSEGGTPPVWTRQTIGTGFASAHGVCAADLDGDGRKDVLATSEALNKISWWHNGGGSPIAWTEHTLDSSFVGTQSVCAADIDHDGDIDVFGAAGGSNEIAMWRNDGGDPLVWTKQVISNTFSFAHWVSVADVDGDGLPDVLGAAFSGNEIAWWRSDGATPISWTKQVIASGFRGVVTVEAADLDGDGDTDVLGSAWTADQVAWWSNGGGNPIQWTKYTIQSGYNGAWPISACDLDGDSDIDVMAGADILGGSGVSSPPTWWENAGLAGVPENPAERGNSGESLRPRCPNPFPPSGTIRYDLSTQNHVRFRVYDALGRAVATLANGVEGPGHKSLRFDADGLASGWYFLRIQAGDQVATSKVLLLR